MTYRHIVLFRAKDHVPDSKVDSMLDVLASFTSYPGVTSWRTARSLDERKGRVVILDATFVNQAAFEIYRTDDDHAAMGIQMSLISDWWIGDYEAG